MPLVPPNSSTTTASDFFWARKICISFCAIIVSGTKGISMTALCQSFGLRNISEEWI